MNYDIVVGGGGQGSITAIAKIAPNWPKASPAVVIALEEVDQASRNILQIIDSYSPIPVAFAVHGEQLLDGRTYLCPPGGTFLYGKTR